MIDPKLLPQRALIDSVVLVLGLGSSKDPRAPSCRDFLDAMEKANRRILVAAPTVAEYLRDGQRPALPRIKGLELVAFDDVAAAILARDFPASVIKQVHQETKLEYNYIKYDSMIVACAIRHKAEHFVTCDRQQTGLAQRVGLKTCKPADYEERQLSLPSKSK